MFQASGNCDCQKPKVDSMDRNLPIGHWGFSIMFFFFDYKHAQDFCRFCLACLGTVLTAKQENLTKVYGLATGKTILNMSCFELVTG